MRQPYNIFSRKNFRPITAKMMNHLHLHIVLLVIFLICNCSLIDSQQPYIRKATNKCDNTDDNSASTLGYNCNGVNPSCQAYLTFRSLPPFNSVSSISSLLSADPSQLSQLNSVPQDATFETKKTVLVPVNCSCSGPYYQYNTSYVVQRDNTFLSIANSIYQGLSTCDALQAQNGNLNARNLVVGTRINVPLRCACPTKNQAEDDVKYLLSYLVTSGQSVSAISSIFGVDMGKTLQANGLSVEDFTIYPSTTLLVPLQNPPSSSQIVEPPPPPQQPPTSTAPSSKSSSSKVWVYALAGTLGGIALISVSVLLVFWFCFRKRKQEKFSVIVSESFESVENPPWKGKKLGKEDASQSFWDSISSFAQSLQLYTYEELKLATDNFSPTCLIGRSIYRGSIKGDYAAIKKMSGDVSEEIRLLNKINHLNLIRLSGVCFNDGYWYLVYEYAANGALSDWLYGNHQGKQKKEFLDWKQRIQIGLDVAAGLNYLHCYTSPPQVHKDLKCSNVLLDGDFRAKITNFGLARAADGHGGEFALTRHIIGTKGYMAPEYLENGLVSTMLDVYSFGVLLLEILTGKEVAVLYESVNSQLVEILSPVLNEKDGIENLSQIIDSDLGGNYPSELAILLIRLIDGCLKKDPSARPSMHEIVGTLSTTVTATTSWESKLSV